MNSISQKFIPASAFILSNVLWSALPESNIKNRGTVRAAIWHPTINVVIFGETGSGKSSVVNMLLGRKKADVSGGAKGCTLRFEAYTYEDYNFYDTTGFSEGSGGTVQGVAAVHNLFKLLKSLKLGVNLLVYVMKKGRITTTIENNYKLFVEEICMSQVPVILVVTGCDFAKDKQWAKDNQKEFENNGMKFEEYLSVCAKKEEWDEEEVNIEAIQKRYAESKKNLHHSIESHILPNGWKWMNTGDDFSHDTSPLIGYTKKIITFIAEVLAVPKSDIPKLIVDGIKYAREHLKSR